MPGSVPDISRLTPAARALVNEVNARYLRDNSPHLGLHHWLDVVLGNCRSLVEALAPDADVADLRTRAENSLDAGEPGDALSVTGLLRRIAEKVHAADEPLGLEHVAVAVLEDAGVAMKPDRERIEAALAELQDAPKDRAKMAPRPAQSPRRQPGSQLGTQAPMSTAQTQQTALGTFGRDLTAEAREGKLPAVIGRDLEIELVIETLCRQRKRNPALVGPAGVGKTAIVEGLAQKIAAGEVPELLRGKRVVALPASSLTAGAGVVGDLEKRMEAVLREAVAEDVILFFDEFHMIVGAGASSAHPQGDVANILKPALARGDFAVVAATTDAEYRRFIEPDAAFERRFSPIRIQELTAVQTLAILEAMREQVVAAQGLEIEPSIMPWLIDFSSRFMTNRFFPDKAIDLLEQCVAYALTRGREKLTHQEAAEVAQRIIGMPLEVSERLETLQVALDEGGLLTASEADLLTSRLEVTLRGLDLRPHRPNAVVMLVGPGASGAEALSQTLAEALFGAPDRVVRIDCTPLTTEAALSQLIGAGPMYVGYGDTLPLHRLSQIPWCVLWLANVHLCHPAIRQLVTQSLSDGFITLADGKRVYVSNAVVVMTADLPETTSGATVGFRQREEAAPAEDHRALAEVWLGEALIDEVDIVSTGGDRSGDTLRHWVEAQLLPTLARRYEPLRVSIEWDPSLIEWLLEQQREGADLRDWERLVEERLAPLLICHIPEAAEPPVTIRVGVDDQRNPTVEPTG